jgi:hypothetical protein
MAYPLLVVLGLSVVVGAILALALRIALRVMSPTSENTAMLFMALLAGRRRAGRALRRLGAAGRAAGRHAAQAAQSQAWAWPRQLGTAGSLLTMLMFVLVSVVAANAQWNMADRQAGRRTGGGALPGQGAGVCAPPTGAVD